MRIPVQVSVLCCFCLNLWAQIPIITLPGDKTFGEEDLIRARSEWFRERRNLDAVPRAGLLRRQAVMETKARMATQEHRAGAPVWELAGPAPMTMLNWAMGMVAGRVSAVAYDPTDPDTIYLGGASGGLWKTTDGGQSWTPVFDSVGTQTIGSIFVEPDNPQRIWVGTGEQSNGCGSYFGLGLFYSPDGGASFVEKNGDANPLLASYVTGIAVHPGNPDIVVAGGQYYCDEGTLESGGLFRSTDRGENWTQLLTGTVNDILMDPSDPDTMYASVGRGALADNGVYKSTNAGASWNRLEVDIPFGTGVGRTRLAISQSDPQTLYALMRFSGTRIYKTTNGGANWTLTNANACEGQCNYNLCIDVNPVDPDSILVGTIRPRISANSGASMTTLTTTWGSGQTVHQDIHVVMYDKGTTSRGVDGSAFWIGSDGGLWKTTNSGGAFSNLNSDLNLTQFYDIAVHPDDPGRIFGGSQDNSSERSAGDPIWNVTFVTGDGFMNLIDPSNPDIVFQTSYANGGFPYIIRSTTGGDPGSFGQITVSGMVGGDNWPWVVQMGIGDVDETTQTHIFVASGRVYRSPVNTISWTDTSGLLGGSSTPASVVTPVPANDAMTLYIGKENGTVFRTDDALATPVTWNDVTGDFPGGWVSGLAADGSNPLRVFASRSVFGGSKLYRSTTGGGTWQAVGAGLPNVPANDVVIDPLNTDRVFVAMDTGVYVSTDGGDTFEPMMNGLPLGVVVNDLEIDDDPYLLTIGTYGRGAWRISLVSAPLVANTGHDHAACAGTGLPLSVAASGGLAPYTYAWSVLSGPDTSSAQFDDTASDSPVFTPSLTGTYTLLCTVTDTALGEITENVEVHVFDGASFPGYLTESWQTNDQSPGWLPETDRNSDGVIDVFDLLIEMDAPYCP